MRALLRWFGVIFFGLAAIPGVALAPASGGLSLLLGIPAALLAASLIESDPADRPDATPGAFVALAMGVVVVVWVISTLIRGVNIYGR